MADCTLLRLCARQTPSVPNTKTVSNTYASDRILARWRKAVTTTSQSVQFGKNRTHKHYHSWNILAIPSASIISATALDELCTGRAGMHLTPSISAMPSNMRTMSKRVLHPVPQPQRRIKSYSTDVPDPKNERAKSLQPHLQFDRRTEILEDRVKLGAIEGALLRHLLVNLDICVARVKRRRDVRGR